MTQFYKTSLGDLWEVTDDQAISLQNMRTFTKAAELIELLQAASENNSAAHIMRDIDRANSVFGKTSVLLNDDKNPGWSRSVRFNNPVLNWAEKDYFWGEELFLTSNPEIALVCHVCDPGSCYDFMEVLKYNEANNSWGAIGSFESLDQAKEFAQNGLYPEPLPAISVDDTVIIELANKHKAEAIIRVSDGLYGVSRYINIFITDGNGDYKGSCHVRADSLIKLRDDSMFLESIIDDIIKDDVYEQARQDSISNEILGFKEIKAYSPNNLQELSGKLESMKNKSVLKLVSQDGSMEMLIKKVVSSTIRTPEGELLATRGTKIEDAGLTSSTLKHNGIASVVVGKEKTFDVSIKKTGGSIIGSTNASELHADRLFSFFHSSSGVKEIKENTNLSEHEMFEKNPSFRQILSGITSSDDPVYITKKEFSAEYIAERAEGKNKKINFSDDIAF